MLVNVTHAGSSFEDVASWAHKCHTHPSIGAGSGTGIKHGMCMLEVSTCSLTAAVLLGNAIALRKLKVQSGDGAAHLQLGIRMSGTRLNLRSFDVSVQD